MSRRTLLGLIVAVVTLSCACASAGATTWTWSSPAPIDHGQKLAAVSCPSADLCVAADSAGDVLRATGHPVAVRTKWTVAAVDPNGDGVRALQCPTGGLCVLVDGAGDAVVSTDPSTAHPTWRSSTIDPGHALTAIDCPTTGLCVATDDLQSVVTSTDPTGGPSAWTRSVVDYSGGAECEKYQSYPCTTALTGISCPTASACAASDEYGGVLISTSPAAGAGAWKLIAADYNAAYGETLGVSCPSTSLCVTADDQSSLATTTAPLDLTASWSQGVILSDEPSWFDCPLTRLCVSNTNWISTDPANGAISWHLAVPVIDSRYDLHGVSCPTATECVAVDRSGNVLYGSPAARPSRGADGRGPRIKGIARVGAVLRARPGDWAGSPPLRYGYQWERCDTRCVPISGALGATYRLTAADRYFRIRVCVTPWDPAGYARAVYSALTRPVGPSR